jgi:MFS family permease
MAVALAALGAGYLAATYALRPQPFMLGLVFAIAGLLISLLFVHETREYAAAEVRQHPADAETAAHLSFTQVFQVTSWKDRALFAVSQAGMVNNLNDGLAWGLLPLYFALTGLSIGEVSLLAAIYPAVWGVVQLGTGALSDRVGRKRLIASGMMVQAAGIFLILLTRGFWPWASGAALLGLGTAMVYPTLLAAIGDVAHPNWRASAVGVYRLWRDGGYAVGALLAGVLADAFGLRWAIGAVGALTLLSGTVVAVVMYETLPARRLR